ncbi:DNA polymerase nu isoform X3 [Mixophyes fleayi]|uniref:DNA polymerase nu isoform X3 n=1 Tax=Mixophyes fleayi TaxID=3061075 RepID=UPI003F4DCEA3
MENYSQDFGFYCRRKSLSLVAGKILTTLQFSHTGQSCKSNSDGKNVGVRNTFEDNNVEVKQKDFSHEIYLKAKENIHMDDVSMGHYWNFNKDQTSMQKQAQSELRGTPTPYDKFHILVQSTKEVGPPPSSGKDAVAAMTVQVEEPYPTGEKEESGPVLGQAYNVGDRHIVVDDEEDHHQANLSKIPSNNTLSIGDYEKTDKSAVIELPGNPEIISTPMNPCVLAGSRMDQDHNQPFVNVPIVTEDGQNQKLRTRLSVLDEINYVNVGRPSCATHELKCFLSQKPKTCVLEQKVSRKLLGKKDEIDKSNEIHLCNIWSMSSEQQCKLIEETNQTKAIIFTMVFQNGSSQLCPSKDSSTSLNGILILLKRESEVVSVNPIDSDIYDKEDIYIFMDITDNALLRKDKAQYNFLRKVFRVILERKTPVICFNGKDFLRTIFHIYGKIMNWKTVAQIVILDPRIASWLLNPADCNPSFEDLVKKYCERVDLRTTGNSQLTKHQITCKSLVILYHLMVKLEHKLKSEELWDLFCTIELPLTPILAVMENNTIQVNEEELKRTSVLLGMHLKELEREAHHAAGEKFRLTSSKELRQVLFEKLHLHLQCKSKLPLTNLSHLPSTAEPTLHHLEDLHPLPRIILQFRQVQKIKSAFVDGLSSYITKGHVSPTWNQTGTVSGRLSAKHPNIQGVSKLSVQFEKQHYIQGNAKEIVTINPRSMFIAAKGHSFLAADFSQIELRLLAHFSSDPELLQLFNEMETTDIFTNLASQWKNVEYNKITQTDREQAKRVVYSVIYGVGKERLSECLGITQAEANAFMERFLQRYKVSNFTHKVIEQCHNKGFVVSLMGRKRPLPHIHSKNYRFRAQAERQAVNFVIQGLSHKFTMNCCLKLRILKYRNLQVPLKVTLSSGKSWGCMSELEVK